VFSGIPKILKRWYFYEGPYDPMPSSFYQHPIQSLVDELVILMQSLVDPTLILEGDASLDHVVSQPIQPLVEEVVVSMQY
jgi:hypothetical protein